MESVFLNFVGLKTHVFQFVMYACENLHLEHSSAFSFILIKSQVETVHKSRMTSRLFMAFFKCKIESTGHYLH